MKKKRGLSTGWLAEVGITVKHLRIIFKRAVMSILLQGN